MARTQAAEYDQRREHIVEQAARLYAKNGFLGASVSDLAEACDISKSAIYHYYPSKEDILFDVMYSHIAGLEESARMIASAEAPPEERLRRLARAFMELYVGAQARHKVLLNELDQLPKARRISIVKLQRELVDITGGILAELAPTLKRSAASRRAATMLFFGMINWTHTWFDPNGPISADAFADMAVSTIISGLPVSVAS